MESGQPKLGDVTRPMEAADDRGIEQLESHSEGIVGLRSFLLDSRFRLNNSQLKPLPRRSQGPQHHPAGITAKRVHLIIH